MGTGETAGHHRDHGPGDHRGVMVGQPLVGAHGAAMLGDPRQGPLHHPPARQHLEGRLARALAHDLDPQAQHPPQPRRPACRRTRHRPSTAARPRKLARRRHSSARPASRSWMLTAVTMTTSSNPQGVHRQVPLAAVDLLAGIPLTLRRGTVSAARTDWESMIAAEGQGCDPPGGGPARAGYRAPGPGCRRRPTWQTTSTPCPGVGTRGQQPPGAARADQVAERVDDLAQRVLWGPATLRAGGALHQGRQHGPLGVGQRGGIGSGRAAGRQARTRGGTTSWRLLGWCRGWSPVAAAGASLSCHLTPKPAAQPEQPEPVLKHSLSGRRIRGAVARMREPL
jgi:hypothetical protein